MTVKKWISLYYKVQLLWFALCGVMGIMRSSEEMILKMTAFSFIIPTLLFITGLIYFKNKTYKEKGVKEIYEKIGKI